MNYLQIRHDFRHYNPNIAALLKKGDIQEVLHYIEQYNERLDVAKLFSKEAEATCDRSIETLARDHGLLK